MITKDQIKKLLDDLPQGSTPKIGIALTEHNRYELFKKSYEETKKLVPDNSVLVVVDDASAKPVPEATYRFKKNVGISVAKNKCLELLYLEGCEHIFLFDSDIYPIKEEWWKPYVENKEPHLMYIFQNFSNGGSPGDTKVVYENDEIKAYDHPRGCMLYLHRSVLDKVGGMDPVFVKWGFEHGNLSDRIFMAGLTSFRYMDIPNSKGLFYSHDEQTGNKNSTVIGQERRNCIAQNQAAYLERKYKSYFVPFIDRKNILLTCYFNGVADPQRKSKWNADINSLQPLIKSLKETKLIVFHDCLEAEDTDMVQFIRVKATANPYFQRWITYRDWMLSNKDKYANVFCIDATDVEVLKEPFWQTMGDNLWTGDENELVGCEWMRRHNTNKIIAEFIEANKDRQLLNAGLVGGKIEVVSEFIRQMIDFLTFENPGEIDMALLNYMAYTNWSDKIRTGRQVCTLFKGDERNSVSWFKHK